jgi:hypothetical protein
MTLHITTPMVAFSLAISAALAPATGNTLELAQNNGASKPCGPAAQRQALSPTDAKAVALSAVRSQEREKSVPVVAVDQTSHDSTGCRETYEATVAPDAADTEICRWITVDQPKPHSVAARDRVLICEPKQIDVNIY